MRAIALAATGDADNYEMKEPTMAQDVQDGRARDVDAAIHPFPDLLRIGPDELYERYVREQVREFGIFLDALGGDGKLSDAIPPLRRLTDGADRDEIARRLDRGRITAIFAELHGHVLEHPVWTHSLFRRLHEGDASVDEVRTFLKGYFGQIKNTRQCVASCLARFNSLGLPDQSPLYEAMSEATQTVLAGILADEYGVHAHETELTDDHDSLGMDAADVFTPTSHIDLFRRLFDVFGVPAEEQDAPLRPGVAHNVGVQRELAGDPRFSPLEALASVGMGMEWGVPIFFSEILAGIVKIADREGLEATPWHLEVLTGHVRQDVAHAVATMLVTAIWMPDDDLTPLKFATSALMNARWRMATDVYESVFGEAPSDADPSAMPRWTVSDPRLTPFGAGDRADGQDGASTRELRMSA